MDKANKFNFKRKTRQQYSNDDYMPETISYYQVSMFPNPVTYKHHLRRYKVDHSNKFVDVKDYHLSTDAYNKFLKIKPSHSYSTYQTLNLNGITPPDMGRVSLARSDILNNESDYTGFAKF